MNEESEPRRRDEEVFSTHARTIAKALSLPGGNGSGSTVRITS
jgi:hypothetical protein